MNISEARAGAKHLAQKSGKWEYLEAREGEQDVYSHIRRLYLPRYTRCVIIIM